MQGKTKQQNETHGHDAMFDQGDPPPSKELQELFSVELERIRINTNWPQYTEDEKNSRKKL